MPVAVALAIGPRPGDDQPSDDVLRAAWLEHRDRILAGDLFGGRPWAFWRFEPGVPDDLRGARLGLVPLDGEVDRREAVRVLEQARTIWLSDERSTM